MGNRDSGLLTVISEAFQGYSKDVVKELVKYPVPENINKFSLEDAGSIMMAFCMMGFCKGEDEDVVAGRIYETFSGEGKDYENIVKALIVTSPTSGIVH